MNAAARRLILGAVLSIGAGITASAQVSNQPTPEPIVTAENEPWYLNGRPITYAGNFYYPSGPQVHFNRYEMVRSGFFEAVPLYTRTTIEPYSMVFVPLSGGLMHPYERRRAGDIAGTVGSTTPGYPVVLPAEEDPVVFEPTDLLQAAAPPTGTAYVPRGTMGPIAEPSAYLTSAPAATVRGAASPAPPGIFRTARKPVGLNGVFIDYSTRRWFHSGLATELDAARFTRIDDYSGFPVYAERGKEGDAIYVAVTRDATELLARYAPRR